jgi:hypothetical protein
MIFKYSAPVVLAVMALGACAAKQAAVTPVPAASAAATAPSAAVTSASQLTLPPVAPQDTTGQHAGGSAPASRAFVDPVTGELRDPTADELAAADSSRVNVKGNATTGTAGTVEIALPGGITEVQLGEKARIEERVCVLANGSITEKCPQPTRTTKSTSTPSASKP